MLTYSAAVKRLINRIFIFLLVFNGVANHARAYGVAAGEMTYEWAKDSTYTISYLRFVDCSSAGTIPDSIAICIKNTCGFGDSTVYLLKNTLISPIPVNYTCPGISTDCTTGSLPGFIEYQYWRSITLRGKCDKWTFSCADGVRDPGILNLTGAGTNPIYTEAILNNKDGNGNSSAFFYDIGPFVFWDSIPTIKNIRAFDPNGDSVGYELIMPMTGSSCAPSNENFNAGYSFPNNPIFSNNTFYYDTLSENLFFTPYQSGKYALAYRVSDYRKKTVSGVTNWVKIGSITLDQQMTVLTRPTPVHLWTLDTTSLMGAWIDSNMLTMCSGNTMSFNFSLRTRDTIVNFDINGIEIGGPTRIKLTHITPDSAVGFITFSFPHLETMIDHMNFYIYDTSCADGFKENTFYSIPVKTLVSATEVEDRSFICAGDTMHITGYGDSLGTYIWDVLPGGASIASLSCTTCANPAAVPNITTTYTLYTPDNHVCTNRDTFTVVVRNRPATPIASSNAPICSDDTLRLSLTDTATVIARRWVGPDGYRSVIKNPKIFPASSGVYKAYDSSNGCASYPDSVTVVVKPKPGKPFVGSNSPICAHENLQLHAMDTTAGVSYYWRTPDTSLLYIVPNPVIPFAQAGIYKSYVTLDGCTSDTAMLTVTVDSAGPPVASIFSFPDTVIPGFYITFKAIVSNAGSKPKYQWQKNGVDIKGATNNVLITNDVKVHDIISVIVYSSLPCAIPDSTVTSTWPLSINELSSSGCDIDVYPNPNKGEFTIKGRIKDNIPNVSVSIMNLLGQTVFTAQLQVNNGTFQRDVSLPGKANGSYILQVQANGASYFTKITLTR